MSDHAPPGQTKDLDLAARLIAHDDPAARLHTMDGSRTHALHGVLVELCEALQGGASVRLVHEPDQIPGHLEAQAELMLRIACVMGLTTVDTNPERVDLEELAALTSALELDAIGVHIIRTLSRAAEHTGPSAEDSGQLTFSFAPPRPPKRPAVLRPVLAPLHKTYETVRTAEQLDAVLEVLAGVERFGFDLETTSLVAMDAEIVGCSFAWRPDHGVYVPLMHDNPGGARHIDPAWALERMRPLLEESRPRKVIQNAKYERGVLASHGITLRGVAFDTMLMGYLLDPDRRSQGLDALARTYLGHTPISYDAVTTTEAGQVSFGEVDLVSATQYAAEDADLALALSRAMEPELERLELMALHDDMELPLVGVLWRMESTGVRVDTQMLEGRIDAWTNSSDTININSPAQLRRVLFEELGLPQGKQRASGASTDQYVLEKLRHLHELPGLILEARGLAKLKSTYVDALGDSVRADTGRVHTSFNQAITATGRLSSSKPNLQNIPMRKDRGRAIRGAFIPREGWEILSADYSQIELRLLAHLSEDPVMIEAFERGEDIHARTAADVLGVEPDALEPGQRGVGKIINFGIVYGMGSKRLARSLGVSERVGRAYIERYFERFSGVRALLESYVEESRASGMVRSMSGRPRIMASLNTSRRRPGYADRVAMNAPIQASAADLIKAAMLDLDRVIATRNLPMSMLLQVHDELVFEVDAAYTDDAIAVVRELMEGVHPLRVPLVVDIGVGANWLLAK